MGLVAGVDCSTQATKVLLVDPDNGSVVASGRASHDVSGAGGDRETDPNQWWNALADALSQTGRAGDVDAIAIGGQQHGLVVLDDQGEPLRHALLWNDVRSADEARSLTLAWGPEAWAERIGLVPVASYTVSKWAWLRRHEPETAAATAAVLLPHDFINLRLTGQRTTDRGDASGTGWWSAASDDYSTQVLEMTGVNLDIGLLPKVLGPGEQAGRVTADASNHTGLRVGTQVAAGTGDNMAAALGLGLEAGTAVMSLGTSGTVYLTSTVPAADSSGTVAGFADATGNFLPLAATLNCTLAVDRFAAWLGLDRDDVAEQTDVIVFPYFDGERTPNLPQASGLITGLRHGTDPREILLAAYQGATLGLLQALYLVISNSSGIDLEQPLFLIGGGAKGSTWRRVVSQLSGLALQIPDAEELVAIGAAAQAAGVLNNEPAAQVARQWDTRKGVMVDRVDADPAKMIRWMEARVAHFGA